LDNKGSKIAGILITILQADKFIYISSNQGLASFTFMIYFLNESNQINGNLSFSVDGKFFTSDVITTFVLVDKIDKDNGNVCTFLHPISPDYNINNVINIVLFYLDL